MVRGEYFWALVLMMGFFMAWRIHVRLRPLVVADPTLERGGRVLVRTIVILTVIMVGVNGGLQYLGGFSNNPAWWASGDLSNPFVLASFLFQALFTVVTLWWVWFANGPARFLKYRAAFPGPQNPMLLGEERGLRWFLTIVPVLNIVVRIFEIVGKRGG